MKSFNPKEFTKGAIAQVYPAGYDDVKFKGILCSACNDDATLARVYFTVDATGKAVSSFAPHIPSTLLFNIVMKADIDEIMPTGKPAGYREMMSNGKPRIVEVVRFFRTWDYDNEQINSFGGMTAICVMDYALKQIRVYPSFCHPEDNFSKVLGLSMATVNKVTGKGFVVDMNTDLSLKDTIESAYWHDSVTWLNPESKRTLDKPLNRFINE